MAWTKPSYSKSQVDKAGNTILSKQGDYNQALKILTNWRASHGYPLHVFHNRLRKVSEKVDKNSLSALRLKRLVSIRHKLERGIIRNLSSMQDIAGCRAVVSNIELARKLYKEHYIRGDLKHKKVNEKDYVNNPKPDGYRSIHLVYKYRSDKGKKDFDELQVEIQIRSKLQHLWATAVETSDFFNKQALKIGEIDKRSKNWSDFFKLVSSAFAVKENTPLVLGAPPNKEELYKQIREKEKELNVIKNMSSWATAIRILEAKYSQKAELKYFLLELDIVGEKLAVTGYNENEREKAIEDHARAEKRNRNENEYDVVLVGMENIKDLKEAYPNYFANTEEFLIELKQIIE